MGACCAPRTAPTCSLPTLHSSSFRCAGPLRSEQRNPAHRKDEECRVGSEHVGACRGAQQAPIPLVQSRPQRFDVQQLGATPMSYLESLFTKYGTDKGIWGYTPYYEEAMEKRRFEDRKSVV